MFATMSDIQEALDNESLEPGQLVNALKALSESDDLEEARSAALLLWSHDQGNTSDTPDDITGHQYDQSFSLGSATYRVLTDDEANAAAREYIEDSLWAFNADFLAGQTGIDAVAFKPLADLCESANAAVLAMVKGTCGLDTFVAAAISADGRGHHLSSYDGEENEQGKFYIYRTN